MTTTELFKILDTGYAYGIKVLRKLVKKGYITQTQRGNQYFYLTTRTEETEDFFRARAQITGKSVYLFPWFGEYQAFIPVGRRLGQTNNKYPITLLNAAARILQNLRYNSYRKDEGLQNQRPYSEDMKRYLEGMLAHHKRQVKYVEEMLRAPIWNESKTVWQAISDEPVDMDKGKANSDFLGEIMYKKASNDD